MFVFSMMVMRMYFYINPVEDKIQGIAVGGYAEDEKGRELLEKLESVEGIFRFQTCQDEEEMIRQIENGTLECGYVFPEGFYENILRGRKVRQIILYCSPASSAHKISYEVVFSELFEILSEDILRTYLEENHFLERGELQAARESVLALNKQYAGNGSTFHFVYETVEEKRGGKAGKFKYVAGDHRCNYIFYVSFRVWKYSGSKDSLSNSSRKIRKDIQIRMYSCNSPWEHSYRRHMHFFIRDGQWSFK